MSSIMEWIARLYAVLAVLPFASFFIIWMAAYAVFRNKKKSAALAMDVTTLLLVGSVSVMYDRIFPDSLSGIWLILLFLLITAGVLGNLQSQIKGRISPGRLLLGIRRVGFIFLGIMYFLLLVIGIIKSVTAV